MNRTRRPIIVSSGLPPLRRNHFAGAAPVSDKKSIVRGAIVALSVVIMCGAIAGQLVHLAWIGQVDFTTSVTRVVATSFSRPDIVDRRGRLLATDVSLPSLYADPSRVRDVDRVVEYLGTIMPDIDRTVLRHDLSQRTRKFVWVRRGISPAVAQRIHDLGLPGLGFRNELRRAYPSGSLTGHVLGAVNVDNKGLSGLERYIDRVDGAEPVLGTMQSRKAPVQTSIDLGVQHALSDELRKAVRRYQAEAASGVVLDVDTGEVVAASSLPDIDPMQPAQIQDSTRYDRLTSGTFELGSIFKAFTIASALEAGVASPKTNINVATPLTDGRHVIRETHTNATSLSVADIFTRSSNVGTAKLALKVGAGQHRRFLETFGLLAPMETEIGTIAAPQVPEHWHRIQHITISYGHGLAVAPLQFAAAAGALLNGGYKIAPTFLRRGSMGPVEGAQVLSEKTSRQVRDLMRLNVTDPAGTGRSADVPGYSVGGKTGTAEVAGRSGYQKKTVISSFLGAFPMEQPRYVVLISIFEPTGNRASGGAITASRNAAPTTGRIIRRIAPLLNIAPTSAIAALN